MINGGQIIGGGGLATKAVYSGTISLTGASSATATITAVVLANSLILGGGYKANMSSTAGNYNNCRVELTNTTTVTALRGASDATAASAPYFVHESYSGTWKTMQRGVINTNGGTSATATITSVDTTKAFLSHNGIEEQAGGAGAATDRCQIVQTNATTLTASNNQNPGATNNVSYQVAEPYA